jgi:hypothetical protein
MLRKFLFHFLLASVVLIDGSFAASPVCNPVRVAATVGSMNAIRPRPLDFRQQDIPKKIPEVAKRETAPNLDPLINQLQRHWELDRSAIRVGPWVYATGTEVIVADYEDAVASLESAEEFLHEAMQNVLVKSNDSLETDPALVDAKLAIDDAEYTILFLIELAINEL